MVNQHLSCDNDKCVGCDICEYACSYVKEGVFNPLKSRIRVVRIAQTFNTAVACKACIEAPCITACPEDALTQSMITGAITVDEEKCKGCDWCLDACKYGAITLHPTTHKAIVCDACGGDPKCIPLCPESALSLAGRSDDKIVTGDIGCYTLGVLPPINALQSCLCMGGGISQAAGMAHAGVKEKVFAVIGDSTFFHAGIPGLLNIVWNKANVCVIIVDNSVVAMTGHQPTPGSGKTAMGADSKIISLEDVARGVGIEKVYTVDPYDLKATTAALRETLAYQGPSVIISKRPCPLLVERGKLRETKESCNGCGVCVKAFGCPAISLKDGRAEIDQTLCYGCGVCEEVCPFEAIGRKT
jgi:indolepyruvate ferredoxin oxidoreductase alpha subunit